VVVLLITSVVVVGDVKGVSVVEDDDVTVAFSMLSLTLCLFDDKT